MHTLQIIGWVLGGLLIAALVIFLFRQLWNWLVPGIFSNVKKITYIQAFGLLLLAKILFGGFPHKGFAHYGYGHCQKSSSWASKNHQGRHWNDCSKEIEKPSVK